MLFVVRIRVKGGLCVHPVMIMIKPKPKTDIIGEGKRENALVVGRILMTITYVVSNVGISRPHIRRYSDPNEYKWENVSGAAMIGIPRNCIVITV